jgi:hypothetical protein
VQRVVIESYTPATDLQWHFPNHAATSVRKTARCVQHIILIDVGCSPANRGMLPLPNVAMHLQTARFIDNINGQHLAGVSIVNSWPQIE